MSDDRPRWRSISIPAELYEQLREIAKRQGYTSVSQLAQFYLRLVARGDIA